jgi:alanyl-tRNA synthetase
LVTTNRLYYQDCYLSSFPAHVIDSADDGRRIYLESTAFYPTSGGQPHDTGSLGGQMVIDVIDEGDRIVHVLAGSLRQTHSEGRIDWPRRFDHMQQHTGQHLLSAVFVQLFGAQTLSFHMGAEVSQIELSMKELTDAQIDAVEQRANAVVWEARPVNVLFEEADAALELRKASDRSGMLRVIEISGLDRSACGGTHVRSTAEVGPIHIVKIDRVRGNIRAEFVCGGRALRSTKQEHRTLMAVSRIASTRPDTLPDYLAALKNRLSEVEKSEQRLHTELARRDGEQAYREAAVSEDGIRRLFLQVPVIDDAIRTKAQAFARLPKALLLVAATETKAVLLACSQDFGVHAGTVLKEVLPAVGGRGGGSATIAQGVLPDGEVLQRLKAQLGFAAA